VRGTAPSTDASLRWRPLLWWAVAASLVGIAITIPLEGVFPSNVLYPVFLVWGALRLRGGGGRGTLFLAITALVFLIVHVPFAVLAFFPDCRTQATFFPQVIQSCPVLERVAVMVVLPLITALVAGLAWREAGVQAREATRSVS
jgi:hypothetical protein